jgi:hypothetical protein
MLRYATSRRAFSGVAVVATLIALACGVGAPAASAAALPVSPVYLNASSAYEGLRVRPATITYTGDGTGLLGGAKVRTPSASIAWSQWTATRAFGSGFNQLNDCIPYCAHGHFHGYPVGIEMWRPRSLGGLLVFTRMTITYKARRPRGEPPHYTFTDTYRPGASGGYSWGPPDAEGYCTDTHGVPPQPSCRNIHSLP